MKEQCPQCKQFKLVPVRNKVIAGGVVAIGCGYIGGIVVPSIGGPLMFLGLVAIVTAFFLHGSACDNCHFRTA